MSKLHLITYGCQMNEYDSERVAGLLKQERYELTDRPEDADLILLLKRERPDLVIGVMGCMAQLQKGRIQERAPYVDLVFGSPAIARVAELVGRVKQGRGPVLETGESALVKITARPEGGQRLKAFVTVMEGCEKYCTFCVVPTTRGRERSHPPEVIGEEIRGLAEAGCREVTLLGQTVNAYGRDLSPPTDLAALLERVNDIDGIERIRFTTSNPYNLTPRLIRAIRDVPKVCELQETVPDLTLSTDLIVGFPGETEEDFARTVEMVEEVGYDNVFAFRYSRRPGTPAAEMADQVPEEVKADRNRRILETAVRVGAARSQRLEGRTVPVLVDGVSRKNAGEVAGRTRCNRVVNFDPGGRDLLGRVVPVRIVRALPHSLRGEPEA